MKSKIGGASFYIKKMKRKILLDCSLKHSIKKNIFYVPRKINLFGLGRGVVDLPANDF